MMRKSIHLHALTSLSLLLLAARAVPAAAADDDPRLDSWPGWRGPLGTGLAPRGEPPLRFGEGENVRFKVEVPGEGHSSPIVWGDRIYLLSAVRTDRLAESPPEKDPGQKTDPPRNFYRFVVLALDRKTGKTLWERTAREELPHEGIQETNTYASGSATTDGRRVYASFGSRGVYSYGIDGQLVWKKDLGRLRTRLGWGEGASPALHRDTLVV